MSFQEKSLWLLFATLAVIFGAYFVLALFVLPPGNANVMPWHIAVLGVLIVLLIIIEIFGSVVLAIISKLTGSLDGRHDTDERDTLIELKGTRNASYVIAVGICLSLVVAVVIPGNFVFTHVLLAFWVLAQLVEIGSQLVLYRRSA